jgi:hypothetical protein
MRKLEARATGDLGMFFRALEDEEAADYWSRQCTRADYALPKEGVDCSWNYGPCLRAARGDWAAVREALDHYWTHGAGNEFNSPLYGGRVYVAAVLCALRGGGRPAWAFVHRWTGFLALQATLAPPPPRGETFLWAGETKPLRYLRTGRGVAIPPTGLRTNGDALRNPMIEPVLAHVLGIGHEMRQPRHWRNWRPPRDKEEWARRGSPPTPFAYLEAVRQAEARSGAAIREQPFMAFCARAVRGDMEAWLELARAVKRAGVPLPRGIVRFVIERRADAVATFWEGRSPTRQKLSVAAGAILGNRRHILIPAKWQIPSTQTRSRITDTEIHAQADEEDTMPRLEDPAGTFELT